MGYRPMGLYIVMGFSECPVGPERNKTAQPLHCICMTAFGNFRGRSSLCLLLSILKHREDNIVGYDWATSLDFCESLTQTHSPLCTNIDVHL
jgi:hypothetical protein